MMGSRKASNRNSWFYPGQRQSLSPNQLISRNCQNHPGGDYCWKGLYDQVTISTVISNRNATNTLGANPRAVHCVNDFTTWVQSVAIFTRHPFTLSLNNTKHPDIRKGRVVIEKRLFSGGSCAKDTFFVQAATGLWHRLTTTMETPNPRHLLHSLLFSEALWPNVHLPTMSGSLPWVAVHGATCGTHHCHHSQELSSTQSPVLASSSSTLFTLQAATCCSEGPTVPSLLEPLLAINVT